MPWSITYGYCLLDDGRILLLAMYATPQFIRYQYAIIDPLLLVAAVL